MKDKGLWTIIVIVAVLAMLDWLGVRGDDIARSIRMVAHNGQNPLLGWALLALVAYSVVRIINHLTRS